MLATMEKLAQYLNRILLIIGGIFLVGMCALTCANIFFRLTWIPIRGTYELMGFFGAVAAAFVLGHTYLRRGHISVDVLVHSFSPARRRVLRAVNGSICAVFFFLGSWQVMKKADILLHTGEVTETLRIIYYPFTYAVAFGCLFLGLILVLDLIKALGTDKEVVR